MTPHEFIAKWKGGGDERRDAQPFFEDLCRLVGHPTPREADPEHAWFTYEYGASKTSGGEGWADVWKRGHFGWEAKGTQRSLAKAYEQLKMYADALQNPPLLVVSDLKTIEVHTNFTNAVKRVYRFDIEQLADFETRQILDAVFHAPDRLKPGVTRAAVTAEAADKFTRLARVLRDRGHAPKDVAHFLNRLLFCMFAEDIGLLPGQLFTKLVERSKTEPDLFEKRSRELFAAMHAGGDVAFENIDWFNGGLFEDERTLRLEADELKLLAEAATLDWSEIEPSIFGTLFERGLDPDKRSQLGAHYTDPETILKIVRPVVIEPWLRAWEAEKLALAELLAKAKKSVSKAAQDRYNLFLERLRGFTVLDPACGSGNFLYLSLRALKDIEKRVLIEAEVLGLGRQYPQIGPRCVKGIELNAYAAELARVTIWIGEIQWMIQNGFGIKRNPILQPLDQIENRDALLNADGSEAAWPQADAVVGNPPFVGDKKMLRELGDDYVSTLRKAYAGRVPGGADLVCYWFEKANDAIRAGTLQRAGLVATNSIRGGRNREVLKHIVDTTRILNAWSDEEWINEGAAVRVSLICFGRDDAPVQLDGTIASAIRTDLTSEALSKVDVTQARSLRETSGIAFQGPVLVGPFEVDAEVARSWLVLPNPHGQSNADVLRPMVNGRDVTGRSREQWVVDFSARRESEACQYEMPFDYVKRYVKPLRDVNRDESRRARWWLHGRLGTDLRQAMSRCARFIATARVAKHRLFVWQDKSTLPESRVYAIARDDDTSFGILHSRVHEVWSLATCSWHGDGEDGGRPTYNAASCFETFPFPEGLTPNIPAAQYATDPRAQRIADAARKLDEARERWLNPPEWTERVPEIVPGYPDRILAKPGHEADLKKRTLTNLYNARPEWLNLLHRDLDTAVAAAYGWAWPLTDDEILKRLFALNQERAAR